MKGKNKKILLINDFLESYGGAERSFFDTVELLKNNNYLVEVLGGKKSFFNSILGGRLFNLKFFFQTFQVIVRSGIDTVWMHNCTRRISVSPLLAAFLLRRKVIMTLHDFHFFCPKSFGIFSDDLECKKGFNALCAAYKCRTNTVGPFSFIIHLLKWLKVGFHRMIVMLTVDSFICPSEKVLSLTQSSLKIDASKFHLIPYFVPEKTKSHVSHMQGSVSNFPYPEGIHFLFVGRVSREKGVYLIVETAKLLVQKHHTTGFYIHVVGIGPDLESMKKRAEEAHISHHLIFHGYLPLERMSNLYSHCEALLVPSLWLDNSPLVIYESMMYGKAVIGSRIGGIPELIEDGRTGYLFPMGNTQELARIMLQFSQDPLLGKKLGSNARQRLDEKYTENIFLEKIFQLI